MSDITQREYYKIFTGTNQFDGYDKIHLGYNAETTEIDLKKDKTTYFHMPFFASPQSINESTLAADGAIPGPIPDLADRIYKKLGNYGNTSPWGTASERSDGTWLCSWLYAENDEQPVWLDRYYNPGRISYKEALEGRASFDSYTKNDPIYFDVVSTLVLEPGVLYQYFHQGEETAINYVTTFAGVDKKNLRLDIEDWSCLCPNKSEPVDKSVYKNTVTIENFKNDWIINPFDPGHRDRSALSFANTDFIDCRVLYNTSYNLNNEFTLAFWVNNPDWSQASSTQIVGNLRLGGFGVYYNNLNYTPFFAIPETNYGHLFYFNQEGNPYLDKNIQSTLGQSSIITSSHLNSQSEVITIDITPTENRVFKYNHIGDRLTSSKTLSGTRLPLEGIPQTSILGINDQLTVITNLSTYIFDKDLLLLSAVPVEYSENDQPRLAYDLNGNLHYELSCTDVKFDSYNKKWHINKQGNLFYENEYVSYLPSNNETGNGTNTNIAIDPENNLWVLANSNTIYKIDTLNLRILGKFEIGVLTSTIKPKNIGFIKTYFRATNSFTWYAIIYHDFEKTCYQATLNGKIYKTTYFLPLLNTLDPVIFLQNKELLTFVSTGDFTGYESRRIFNKLLYNNNPQIQFKVSVNPANQELPNSIYTLSIPAQYLTNNDWHLITATVKNQNISLYVNSALRASLEIPSSVNFTYDYKNDFYIGTPCGKTGNYNTEILSQGSIWNGYIDTVKIYDYAIDTKFITYFIREKTYTSDIEWNIPTASLPYIEVIDRFFKHRLPGHKSNFFNIRLTGTKITDLLIRQRIERELKIAIAQIKPAYTELFKVEWID